MKRIDFINKLEDDLVLLGEADRAFQVEICKVGLASVGDEVWLRGAQISRAIISARKNVTRLKLDAGGYASHVDVPSRIGGSFD